MSDACTAITDDLLVTGAGDTYKEALVDRNRNLIALFTQCRERNFRLSKEKFVFKLQKLKD